MCSLIVYNNLMQLPQINLLKVRGFIIQHRISAVIVFVAIVVAIGVTIYGLNRNIAVDLGGFTLKEKVETRVPAPLTGELVDPAVAERRPLAVVIENHTEARPQSGYLDADIVYETLAEGGITRTLAIFQSKESKEVGPVRSAREYFVDWATELNAIFTHVGGSADALDLIAKIKTPDLNQFYNADSFWRSSDRYAPHNVYTTTEKLLSRAKSNGLETSTKVTPLSFKKEAESKDRTAGQQIAIDFSGYDYNVGYTYDLTSNTYFRSIAKIPAKDRLSGTQIAPKNVIVYFTSTVPYINYEGAQGVRIGLNGKAGKGYFFQDGKTIPITWSKASRSAQTKYLDESGKEIRLNPGQTWIEVVPEGRSVTF